MGVEGWWGRPLAEGIQGGRPNGVDFPVVLGNKPYEGKLGYLSIKICCIFHVKLNKSHAN